MRDDVPPDGGADATIALRVQDWYAQTPAAPEQLRVRINEALGAVARQPARHAFGRRVHWSSVGAAAAAVMLVAVGVLAVRRARPARDAEISEVPFAIDAPHAARVALVGNFNQWDARATPMRRTAATGRWTAALRLAPGRHVYAYILDGKTWTVDSVAPRSGDKDYGSINTVLVPTGR
ncbi:MAG TPA: isoamylase early set domain-containing protein [Gemmatimonadaceae bacterium]|nr:isoamylase early set domain-containing protein [Gemmatimonadaceae bacterium]